MHWITKHNLHYMQFSSLAALPGLWHGIFPRFTGNGNGGRIPFNLGLNCGDDDLKVWANRQSMISAAGGGLPVFARQVHGAAIGIWDPADVPVSDHVYLDGDALITAVPDVALVIQSADCQSVLLVDPVERVVANVHSGWRGSLQNVVGRTVQAMVARFGVRPERLICAIGPSLGPCCAELIHYREEVPAHYWGYRREGDLFDFWRLSVDQLTAEGVAPGHISASGICTRCNPHVFFTYRGEGPRTGRFASLIQLKNDPRGY